MESSIHTSGHSGLRKDANSLHRPHGRHRPWHQRILASSPVTTQPPYFQCFPSHQLWFSPNPLPTFQNVRGVAFPTLDRATATYLIKFKRFLIEEERTHLLANHAATSSVCKVKIVKVTHEFRNRLGVSYQLRILQAWFADGRSFQVVLGHHKRNITFPVLLFALSQFHEVPPILRAR